jgi:biopolymer transport protein ExbD
VNFQPRRTEEPDLNMTSLIDVVLLLLIFFMLSTRFIDEGRLELRLPEAGLEPQAVQEDVLEIDVSAQGTYQVNGHALTSNTVAALTTAIAAAAADARPSGVIVRADARASHQSVVTALDAAGRAGQRQVSIATVNDGQESR